MKQEIPRGFYEASKAHFKRLIFKTILQRGPISRRKLSELLHIRYVTLQRFVADLLAEDMIGESGNVVVRRGRAPIFLTVNPHGGLVVGIALGPGEVAGVLFGLDMKELASESRVIDPGGPAEAIVETIFALVDDMLASGEVGAEKLLGIGYGEYGLIDTEQGIAVRSTYHRNWTDIRIKQILEERFRVTVNVAATERCILSCERTWGHTRTARTALFLDVEEGVGFAAFSNGEMLSGSRGFAGEIGHIKMVQDGELCLCGARGCLETVASTRAIVNQVKSAMAQGIRTDLPAADANALTIRAVVEAAAKGDSLSSTILNSALTYLGRALGIAINFYNPDTIILRGRMFIEGGADLLEVVRREANTGALRELSKGIQWDISTIENAAAKGAGARMFDFLFDVGNDSATPPRSA